VRLSGASSFETAMFHDSAKASGYSRPHFNQNRGRIRYSILAGQYEVRHWNAHVTAEDRSSDL
jgi:hypothetical protein